MTKNCIPWANDWPRDPNQNDLKFVVYSACIVLMAVIFTKIDLIGCRVKDFNAVNQIQSKFT